MTCRFAVVGGFVPLRNYALTHSLTGGFAV